MLRRIYLSLLILGWLLLGAGVPAASADDQWCSTDPPVQIVTPAGNHVTVFVTEYALGTQHLAALTQSQISYTVASDDAGTTHVVISVLVPNDVFASGFQTKAVASSNPNASGTIYAQRAGVSGVPMLLPFTLDIP